MLTNKRNLAKTLTAMLLAALLFSTAASLASEFAQQSAPTAEATLDVAANATIRVGVKNSSQVTKRWIVRDRKTNKVVLDATFSAKETKWIYVTSSNGRNGDIQYRHANRSYWSDKGVTAGKVHDLY